MHAPKIPEQTFAHLVPERRSRAQQEYEARFNRALAQLDRATLEKAVERMPVVDVLLMRSALQSNDTAEIGRIFANMLTETICADAVTFAAGQRALLVVHG